MKDIEAEGTMQPGRSLDTVSCQDNQRIRWLWPGIERLKALNLYVLDSNVHRYKRALPHPHWDK